MTSFKDYISESINDKGIFKAIFVVGLSGAGKSYSISKLTGEISPVIVNTDRAAEYLAKKLQINVSSEAWHSILGDKSKKMTKESLKNYINGMVPLFIDGTTQSIERILHRVGILESIGYDVGVVYINSSLQRAKERAKEREQQTGRAVDPEFIELTHIRSVESRNESENMTFLEYRVGYFKEIINDTDELGNKELEQAYNSVQSFFKAQIKNPIGRRAVNEIVKNKAKYLVPQIISERELSEKIEGWYR